MDNTEPPVEDEAIDVLRDSPVGTNDPNIVGDIGTVDTPTDEVGDDEDDQ